MIKNDLTLRIAVFGTFVIIPICIFARSINKSSEINALILSYTECVDEFLDAARPCVEHTTAACAAEASEIGARCRKIRERLNLH